MKSLDLRTLERVAQVVVDHGGAYERSGWRLETLLDAAGWQDPPGYDGSSRVRWMVDVMAERDPEDVERLLVRACHPVEHGSLEEAEPVRAALDLALAPERLSIEFRAGAPVLVELSDQGTDEIRSMPADIEERLARLVDDEPMRAVLLGRVRELRACESQGAYVMALVCLGSLVEGLLYSFLSRWAPRSTVFVDASGKTRPPQRITLNDLIESAYKGRWIEHDAKEFVHRVRDYRNFVHPRQQRDLDFAPDADTLMMCWAPVAAMLNDLDAALTDRGLRP